MRRGELLALPWVNVDLDKATVRVEHSLEETAAGLRFRAPKTRSGMRTISLPASVVAVLREHRVRQLELRMRGQARITHPCDRGMALQPRRELHREGERPMRLLTPGRGEAVAHHMCDHRVDAPIGAPLLDREVPIHQGILAVPGMYYGHFERLGPEKTRVQVLDPATPFRL